MAIDEMINQFGNPGVRYKSQGFVQIFDTGSTALIEKTDNTSSVIGFIPTNGITEASYANIGGLLSILSHPAPANTAPPSPEGVISTYVGATPAIDPGTGNPQGHVNWAYPVPTDCAGLMVTQQLLLNEIQHVNEAIANGDSEKTSRPWIAAYQERLTEVNNRITALQCVTQAEQQQTQADQALTLAALAQATDTAPAVSGSKANQYILYAIGGVMIIAAVMILVKKKAT